MPITPARIGPSDRREKQGSSRGTRTGVERQGVNVRRPDAQRQMKGVLPVMYSGSSDGESAVNGRATDHRSPGQIGVRRPHPSPVVDRYDGVVDDHPSKGHVAGTNGMHLRMGRRRHVDTPVARPPAGRGERLHHGGWVRGHETKAPHRSREHRDEEGDHDPRCNGGHTSSPAAAVRTYQIVSGTPRYSSPV